MGDDYRTLNDLDVTGKRVLVRADLNVPIRDGCSEIPMLRQIVPTVSP